jgi:hypothetical protein
MQKRFFHRTRLSLEDGAGKKSGRFNQIFFGTTDKMSKNKKTHTGGPGREISSYANIKAIEPARPGAAAARLC